MGLSLREILNSEFFKDFKMLAGHAGLDKQVQGVAILDAPDGFNWTRGKELVISTGYIFYQNPGLFESYVKTEKFKQISGMGIKVERFLKKIPDHIIEAFNEYDIPLINIPSEPPWMDLMNQLNVLVMNKNIRQFNIGNINPKSFSDLSYQARKVDKILSQIEKEMNFPAMLYDLTNERAYYSSPAFAELTADLKKEDFWGPSFQFSEEILCDNLKMIRYRFYDSKYDKPYSWITVPITVGDKIKAYFVVVEATGLIDYFDQFALRIGFLLLQSLYEQILVAQSIGDIGFEKLVTEVLEGSLLNHEMLGKRASDLGLDINRHYHLLLMKQINKEVHLSRYKDALKNAFSNNIRQMKSRMAGIDENNCIFLVEVDDKLSKEKNLAIIRGVVKKLQKRLENEILDISLVFGLSDISDTIYELKRNYARCERAISIGRLLYPEEDYLTYSELGVFAWIDIKEDELEIMLRNINQLVKKDGHKELVKTLKTYLEFQMNYSLTAKQLFVHINTVRKRIDEINDLINLNLYNPMDRLKLEILLKLIN
ncbi:MAG: PucR family transcriptional regulator [Bacillota bacterium]